MSLFDNPESLRLLQNLLNPQERENDSDIATDDDEATLPCKNFTPADIAPKSKRKQGAVKSKPDANVPEKVPASLEEWQALQVKEDQELLEQRKQPEYTLKYRQAVATEDVFLQMNNRTNASASCEDLVVEISLPEETIACDKMDLTITETELDLGTPVYRLRLPFVHSVDVDKCRAKYDAERRSLTLTLRLRREFDFVNF